MFFIGVCWRTFPFCQGTSDCYHHTVRSMPRIDDENRLWDLCHFVACIVCCNAIWKRFNFVVLHLWSSSVKLRYYGSSTEVRTSNGLSVVVGGKPLMRRMTIECESVPDEFVLWGNGGLPNRCLFNWAPKVINEKFHIVLRKSVNQRLDVDDWTVY